MLTCAGSYRGQVSQSRSHGAGTTVTLRHAEVLDKDGNFYTANLRKAKAAVQYTLKGGDAVDGTAHLGLGRGFAFDAPGRLVLQPPGVSGRRLRTRPG